MLFVKEVGSFSWKLTSTPAATTTFVSVVCALPHSLGTQVNGITLLKTYVLQHMVLHQEETPEAAILGINSMFSSLLHTCSMRTVKWLCSPKGRNEGNPSKRLWGVIPYITARWPANRFFSSGLSPQPNLQAFLRSVPFSSRQVLGKLERLGFWP